MAIFFNFKDYFKYVFTGIFPIWYIYFARKLKGEMDDEKYNF